MSTRRPPRLAQALLRHLRGPFQDSLEGDLLEEFATGRTRLWFWHQVGCALHERAWQVIREQTPAFLATMLFFLLALWAIAPVTYPVMGWARMVGGLDSLVLLVWLAGVPLLLGGVAGTVQRRRYAGAILLAAACAYLTPLTLPFTTAACDLCSRTEEPAVPNVWLRVLTPIGSALLAGAGAWIAHRIMDAARRTAR